MQQQTHSLGIKQQSPQSSTELAPPASQAQHFHRPNNGSKAQSERKISCEDIQMVQNLIEQCLQRYMNQMEVVDCLLKRANIEPGFTKLVWQKLEEQNSEFFKIYYTKLKLKKHITTFNTLLEQQLELMEQLGMLPHTQQSQQQQQQQQQLQQSQLSQSHITDSVFTATEQHAVTMQQDPNFSAGNMLEDTFEQPQQSPCTSSSMSGAGVSVNAEEDDFSFHSDIPTMIDGCYQVNVDDRDLPKDSFSTLGTLPRNFSFSDIAADLDLGQLDNFSSPYLTPEAIFENSPNGDDDFEY